MVESGHDYYRDMVAEYNASKNKPWRIYIERYTYLNLIGKLENEDVIDLACGGGYYTRLLREKTKGKVYGVDISEGMIVYA